jgi:ribose transport system permease protein
MIRTVLSRVSGTELGLLLGIVGGCIGLSFFSPQFLTAANLLTVSRQMAVVCIMAVGECYVIISGEFDLSVGSNLGLVAVLTAWFVMVAGWSYPLAVMGGLLVGVGIGLINGVLVTKAKIPSFIVTLGTLMVGRGLMLTITKGWPITIYGTGVPQWFLFLGAGRVHGVPMQAIVMVIVLVIGYLVLGRTKVGYHLYAVGGGARASHLHGIPVDKIKIFTFALTGFLAAIAGILVLSFVQSGDPGLGNLMEMDVIAAVVIGGTSIRGGHGTILGVFLGALIMALILNGLVLLGIGAYFQRVAVGAVIIGAVWVSTIRVRAARLRRLTSSARKISEKGE